VSQYIVGIGASAGGLEALFALLPRLNPNGHVSYVIAQHMAHDGHSDLMEKLLNRYAKIPVILVTGNEDLRPDHVYLIPAGVDGTVQSGQIVLSEPLAHNLSTPSVNLLFESIATAYQKKGIGVILSGTGSDGTNGCRSIKAKGGITIAQHPNSAIFNGMPTSAIEAGVVDLILGVEEISTAINNILPSQNRSIATYSSPLKDNTVQPLGSLIQLIKEVTKIDFSGYKEETLKRRLDTRMSVLGIETYEDYLNHLAKHIEEIFRIQQLFLVSFSSFFRDASSFALIRAQLRQKILAKKNMDTLRILVAGCASGEEAYTFAIIANELKSELSLAFEVSIVGVDLNPVAIEQSIAGTYDAKAFKEVDPSIIDDYFQKVNGAFLINDEIKSTCKFHNKDLFNYALDQSYDLISCRNLLIYLKGSAQDQLVRKFHGHLEADSLLFLGQSEMLSPSTSILFHQIDVAHNVYINRQLIDPKH
jgi:chemotaxis methyl-accepting protein methylase